MDSNQYYIDHGISLENRILDINGDITEYSMKIAVRALRIMMMTSVEPITIIINSGGGSIYDGLALIDMMNHCKRAGIVLNTIASGQCMSMALAIFINGDYRVAEDNVSFMAHSASSWAAGKIFEMKDSLEEAENLNNLMLEMIAENTKRKYTLKWWTTKLEHKDFFFNSTQALEMGVANCKVE